MIQLLLKYIHVCVYPLGFLGPIIRVSPREIHINDVDFLENIYSTSNARKRDKDWMQTRGLDVGMSTSGTIPHDLHRLRREALQPFFSRESVMKLEPTIKQKISLLCAHFGSAQASGRPLNLSDLYYALARDIVFTYSFGKESNVLDDEQEAAALRQNMTQLLLGVKVAIEGDDKSGSPLTKHTKLIARLWRILERADAIRAPGKLFARFAEDEERIACFKMFDKLYTEFPQHCTEFMLLGTVGLRLADCLSGKEDPLHLLYGNKVTESF